MKYTSQYIQDKPLLIFVNKIDIQPYSEDVVSFNVLSKFGLIYSMRVSKIFYISALEGKGVQEGL